MTIPKTSDRTTFSCFRDRRRALVGLALGLGLGVAGCKDDKAEETKDGPAGEAAAAGSSEPSGYKEKAKSDAASPGTPSADAIAPATQIQRGDVLGHVLLGNPGGFLEEIKNQAAPAQAAGFLSEQTLRMMAGAQLGSRSGIASNIELDKPLGCVLVNIATADFPTACVIGYKGGAGAAITDLGNDGKASDAGGHKAKYSAGGTDVFIDELDGRLVVSNHPEAFGKAQDYLTSNVIERADKVASDIELVLFPGAVIERYRSVIEPLLAAAQSTPVSTDNELGQAFQEYNKQSMQQTLRMFSDMEQVTVGVGLEPIGFVARWASFATEGSQLQSDMKKAAAGAVNTDLVKSLPAGSTLVVGQTVNWSEMMTTEQSKQLFGVLADAYAKEVGKDPAAVKTAVEDYWKSAMDTYTPEIAAAFLHQPGTVGGAILASKLKSGSGRDAWKSWSDSFGAAEILGPEASKYVTWSFKADAAQIGGVPVDRWVIEPTADGKAAWRDEMGAEAFAKLESKVGEIKLTIDRAEVDGTALFAINPGAGDAYTNKAIAAAKTDGALGDDAGLSKVLGRASGMSAIMAVDVAKGAAWVKDLLPPGEAGKIPASLGQDLSDIYMVASYGQEGTQTGEFVVSQQFIDQIRALAGG